MMHDEKVPIRNLNKSGGTKTLTWSVMNKWLSCRRQWYYRYVCGIGGLPSMPLLEGDLYHRLFEAQAKHDKVIQENPIATQKEITYRTRFEEAYAYSRVEGELSEIIEGWVGEVCSQVDDGILNFSDEEVRTVADRTKDVFFYWLKRRAAHDLRDYKVIEVEPMFPRLHMRWGDEGDTIRSWRWGGKLDLLLKSNTTGEFILREYKTSGSDTSHYEDRVEFDPQVRLYAFLAKEAGLTDGQDITRVQYAAIRKAVPKQLQLVQCFGCNGKGEKDEEMCEVCFGSGRAPSKAKRADTTREIALAQLKSLGLAHEVFVDGRTLWRINPHYEEFVGNLADWDKFFSITTLELTEESIAEARHESVVVAREIETALRKNEQMEDMISNFPRNISHCTGGGRGGYCSFKNICKQRLTAGRIVGDGWRIVSDHPELGE